MRKWQLVGPSPHWLRTIPTILLAFVFLFGAAKTSFSQVSSGSLSGTVTDSDGAVVPGAKIELKNEATGSIRETLSNGSGYFNFAAIPPNTYTVTVNAAGFNIWTQQGIVFYQGENRTLSNIILHPAGTTQQVEVMASAEMVPLDTGESRTTLNTNMITQLSIQGRNVSELVKLMPGMAMNTGLGQSQYNSLTTSTNGGPAGQFSASGTQPYGSFAMTYDGANIIDGGNGGTQIININQDQTAEATMLNSGFSAEFAKGPVVFQAIGKSGSDKFHGGFYLYSREGTFNSTDAYLKSQGTKKPDDKYFYPGFQIGGPVILPGLSKLRNKLFFFGGYEYMWQHPAGTLRQSFVPSADMLSGNFSPSYWSSLYQPSGGATGQVPCSASQSGNWWYGNFCGTAQGQQIQNGMIPTSLMDPNALAMIKLLPTPNETPTPTNPYNYKFLDNPPVNRWEVRGRLDYSFSENTKIYGSYTQQNEGDTNNMGVWWWPGGTVPYPSSLQANTVAKLWSGNFTKVFTPTLTNEVIVAYAYFTFPNKLTNSAKVDPTTAGFTAKGVFSPGIQPQIPNLVSWACNSGSNSGCFPHLYAPGFTSSFNGGGFGNIKRAPSVADNLSKVWGTHSTKFGFYWDLQQQYQTSGVGSWGQGLYDFETYGSYTTGNVLADLLLGHAQSFSQVSALPIQDMRFHQYAFYGQDQWKLNRRLTLTYGVRFDHMGQWFAENHPGLAVWDPSTYNNTSSAPTYSGITWHAQTKNVPISGYKSPLFTPNPRVGVAYDVFGNGDTVIRGGFGIYRWQFTDNDTNVGFNVPLNISSISTPSLTSFGQAASYQPTTSTSWCVDSTSCPTANALKMNDDKIPYTQSWDVVWSQHTPWNSVVEIQYQGNRTRNALLTGNGTTTTFYANLNKIPVGGLFGTDPLTGVNYYQQSCAIGNCTVPTSNSQTVKGSNGQQLSVPSFQGYRPYLNYGQALIQVQHGSYSNYNSMVLSWQKQAGKVTFLANYTWSKVMGIRDGQSNNGNGDGASVDAFNLKNNYGPLAYDHTQIFNAAYVVNLPSPIKGNPFLGGAVNGWQLSGATQFQSGPPLQPLTAGNLNLQISGTGNQQLLGTDSQVVMPLLTCNPAENKPKGAYFNPACFTGPQIGQNGPAVWPYIKGPAYSNSDLSLYKNFGIKERQNVQFRLSAFNFLNHPLPQFGLTNDVNLTMVATRDNPSDPNGHITYTSNGNANTTGRPTYKVGRRVLEFALKYNF